jgi:hypothetical protein
MQKYEMQNFRESERKLKHEKPKFRENLGVTLGIQEGHMSL